MLGHYQFFVFILNLENQCLSQGNWWLIVTEYVVWPVKSSYWDSLLVKPLFRHRCFWERRLCGQRDQITRFMFGSLSRSLDGTILVFTVLQILTQFSIALVSMFNSHTACIFICPLRDYDFFRLKRSVVLFLMKIVLRVSNVSVVVSLYLLDSIYYQ